MLSPGGRGVSWAEASLAPLRGHEFRLLFLGQAISTVGTLLSVVALPFAVLSVGGSATDIGMVEAAYLVPLGAALLFGGVWADRLPRRAVMLVADAVRAAAQVGAAILLVGGQARIWHLVLMQVAMGAGEAFFRPAYVGLLPQVVPSRELQQANALNGLIASGSITIGSLAGGLLVAGVGAGWAIGLDAVTYLASAGFLLLMRPVPAAGGERGQSFIADIRAGWTEFRGHTWLWVMVVCVAVFLFTAQAPYSVLGPVVAQEAYRGARTWGFMAAALGIGQIGGGALALRWRPSRPLLVLSAGLSLAALPPALLALRAPTPALLSAAVLLGVEWGLYHPYWMTALQQNIAPAMLSRVSSYDYLGSLAIFPLGLAVAGPLGDRLGISTTLLAGAACAVVMSVVLVSTRSIRELRQAATEDAPRRQGRERGSCP